MPDPTQSDLSQPRNPALLAVSPVLLAETGSRLSALTDGLIGVAPHYRGPLQPPALGNPACTSAYATAHQQLGGLVTTAVGQGRQLAQAMTAAAAVYAVLDANAGR